MKTRSTTAATLSLLLTAVIVAPIPAAHAGAPAECGFTPDSFTLTIDPALFDIDNPDPSDPAVATLFEPATFLISATQRFTGDQPWAYFTVTAGGTTYVDDVGQLSPPLGSDGVEIPFPALLAWFGILPGAGSELIDLGNDEFIGDFTDFGGWMDAIMNPELYPMSVQVSYADPPAPDDILCSITFRYEIGSSKGGSLLDFDLSHFLDRVKSSDLPDTL